MISCIFGAMTCADLVVLKVIIPVVAHCEHVRVMVHGVVVVQHVIDVKSSNTPNLKTTVLVQYYHLILLDLYFIRLVRIDKIHNVSFQSF